MRGMHRILKIQQIRRVSHVPTERLTGKLKLKDETKLNMMLDVCLNTGNGKHINAFER